MHSPLQAAVNSSTKVCDMHQALYKNLNKKKPHLHDEPALWNWSPSFSGSRKGLRDFQGIHGEHDISAKSNKIEKA